MKIKDAIEIINSNMRTIDCPTPLGRAIQTLIDATKDDDACVSTCQEVAVLRKQLAEKEERILELYHHEAENFTLKKKVKVDEGKIEAVLHTRKKYKQ